MESQTLLKCPRDAHLLHQCAQNIAALRCSHCDGLLLDLKRSKSAAMRKIPHLSEIEGSGVPSPLLCPISGEPMRAYFFYDAEIDYCHLSQQVWLDANEYEIIASTWLKQNEYKPRQPIDKDKVGGGEVFLSYISDFIFVTLFGMKRK